MRVFHGFDTLPAFTHPAVTVGSYDGVHLGHRSMIERLVAEAHRIGGESIVLTFDPHPRVTLRRDDGFFQLTTLDQKINLLAELGVDNVIVIPFDSTFSARSGKEFIEDYLIGRIGAETLVMGYDHHFGHDRIGCDALTAYPELRIVRVDECNIDGGHVSSTVIRALIVEGRIAEAEHLLGHPLTSDTTIVAAPDRSEALITRLADLWQASVSASHDFLTPNDIETLRPIVHQGLSDIETLVVAGDLENPKAFIGIEGDKVEMLFVAPGCFGHQLGRKLMTLAIQRFGILRVDVNEQNPQAQGFYRHLGFEVCGRTACDAQGKPFPILEMQLKKR